MRMLSQPARLLDRRNRPRYTRRGLAGGFRRHRPGGYPIKGPSHCQRQRRHGDDRLVERSVVSVLAFCDGASSLIARDALNYVRRLKVLVAACAAPPAWRARLGRKADRSALTIKVRCRMLPRVCCSGVTRSPAPAASPSRGVSVARCRPPLKLRWRLPNAPVLPPGAR